MGAGEPRRRSALYRLTSTTLKAINSFVHYIDGSSKEHYGRDPYLLGSFAPVHEECHEEVEVLEGKLPADMVGAYLRTGPNPKLPPMGGYHWFDGDGMIHAVRIAGGKATYCNRFVQTSRLAQEEEAGWPVAAKIGDYRGLSSLAYMALRRLAEKLGVLDPSSGLGTGNTAIAYHANRVLALHEGDLPYALRIACNGLVETLGRASFGGKIGTARFTAHPKTDPKTGELLTFSYSVEKQPFCWYGALDAEGRITKEMPVPLPEPIMMHDCAITENYMLLLDVPLVFDPKVMVKEGKLPFVFKDRPARIGVLPRSAKSADEIRWFTTERFMCFHTANAWEVGNKIRLFLCTFTSFSLEEFTAEEGAEPVLTELTLDLDTGSAEVRRLSDSEAAYGDFPVVHPALVGRPTRYSYVANMQPNERGVPQFIGITKFDLAAGPGKNAIAGRILHGGSRLGGEAVFVPRAAATGGATDGNKGGAAAGVVGDEDDGYLMTYVTDEETLQSELVIYDASSMSSTPVARLRMPHRVPHGFHGGWVTGAQLAAQDKPSALLG